MYIIIGNEIVDSEELKIIIDKNSKFKVEKDLSKSTKREDIIAYQLSINMDYLDTIISEQDEYITLSDEEKFDEYMTLSDELALGLEELMPKYTIINARAYKLDEVEGVVKIILVIAYADLGHLKLSDVIKRLLRQID
ncbi:MULTISPECIES: hypothetical protein [unclassified Clostridioides]|uniref:hypothetical protein n=1 Tax=unclassified Clostridioides TaxID=2635829 RepID=UPI001D0CA0D0|nr:hypothetical protein [Clostridioides sp. ES-S-0001-02]MCC0642315.1 hypothetical protein [Clostridioides sp. ES-S-0049-03]MCC0658411.1 hypothetical protein [Clostridioides sp. ES-S-0123-01]MCC0678298.1 hypothetical protein [Clostridioides sp. ES-W-0018-02]MCC0682601.1 hypothetical protein [Clostridioides sp. ES-S-0005-03]MCC0704969.1 hypothetical protein [Clostridioides sp. ES-S-0049-02]MCC0705582.1 hypothetical protein [Clostridioides sp. ES-S-0190-01]MCC0713177.1 hypothetical protein [Cl